MTRSLLPARPASPAPYPFPADFKAIDNLLGLAIRICENRANPEKHRVEIQEIGQYDWQEIANDFCRNCKLMNELFGWVEAIENKFDPREFIGADEEKMELLVGLRKAYADLP